MRRVRGRNTSPEIALRHAIFARGFRYRLHVALPGKPDIVLARYKSAIFVNGCFWHWHGCVRSRWPSDNAEYWQAKIARNRARDIKNYFLLMEMGWRVLIVWECAVKKSLVEQTADEVMNWLKGGAEFGIVEPA